MQDTLNIHTKQLYAQFNDIQKYILACSSFTNFAQKIHFYIILLNFLPIKLAYYKILYVL